jgi:DNA-binding SARP family transcriptional activator
VDTSVVRGVETPLKTIEIRMLGPLAVRRHGAVLPLPASRKVRALFAYLALAPQPVTRGRLCELLWDVPNDPRGELRWCLTKIRGLIDEPGRRRLETPGDGVWLDLSDCFVDAIEVERATQAIDTIAVERVKTAAAFFVGDFLEGLEMDRNPAFSGWLAAQRRRFRDCNAVLLERLVGDVYDDEILGHLEKWLELAPFDIRVHALLFEALALRDRIRDGDEHLAAIEQLFESEDLDCTPIRDAWRSARARRSRPTQVHAAPSFVTMEPREGGKDEIRMVVARRASVAVMPFVDRSAVTEARGGTADGFAHDVITRLAKLRSLFVIAQGTMFALHERRIGPQEAGKMLNVDYVVSGSVRRLDDRLTVTVELAEAQSERIVWTEVFDRIVVEAFDLLDEIGNSIVASIATEIERNERNRAILRPPNSLDAWEAHHRGLWHVYRFNKSDNDRAQAFFETAVRLDPTFARAYAGLSFTHFQNAFQGWAERQPAIERAYESAGKSVMADDRDPAAHLAIGRALWLGGRFDDSVLELEQTIELSPSFALGHYSLAFVHSQVGDPLAAISSSDQSRRLSPFDPLLFGMFGTRAMALVRLGRFDEAADYGIRAAARPNAHVHILAIAAFALALAGRTDEARAYAMSIRKTLPHYRADDFLTAMRFGPDDAQFFRSAARRIGMT